MSRPDASYGSLGGPGGWRSAFRCEFPFNDGHADPRGACWRSFLSLVRLIYCSKSADAFDSTTLVDLVTRAQTHNHSVGITGVLFSARRRFLQVLEGDPNAVNRLYERLVKDERHHSLTLVDYRAIDQREFHRWAMAHRESESFGFEEPELLRHSNGYFDPYNMTAGSAFSFLAAVAERSQSQARVSAVE